MVEFYDENNNFLYKVESFGTCISESNYNHVKLYSQVQFGSRQVSVRISCNFSGEDEACDFSLAFDDVSLKLLYDVDSISSEVQNYNLGDEPVPFLLGQNFPNPFNNQTVIPYIIPVVGKYNLHIYNLNGQRVRTLLEGEQKAGRYAVNWDGKDNSGKILASGIYIYQLNSEITSITRKLMLMK